MSGQHFHSYFKKKLTFMIVPHDGGKPFQVKTTLFFIHFMVLLLVAIVAWAGTLIWKDVNYQMAQAAQQKFKANMQDVLNELETNRVLINQMAQVDTKFRKLLKLNDRKKVFEMEGMGGPTEEDSNQFSELLKEKNDQLMEKVGNTLKSVNQEASDQEASFKQISVFLDKQRSILAATPSIWPVKGWITSGFGKRASPLTGEPGVHKGVDIANEIGTPIRVTADGIVTYAGWETGYGRGVVVEHGYGYSTRYGHCSRIEISVGQEVKRGQIIGYVGSTGRSTGSHCHYEVRIHGIPVDPVKYLPQVN